MENEKMVTLTLTKSQFGYLFSCYLSFVDEIMSSPNLSAEEKELEIGALKSVGSVLWCAVPVFVPVHSLRSLREIDWGYCDESKQ